MSVSKKLRSDVAAHTSSENWYYVRICRVKRMKSARRKQNTNVILEMHVLEQFKIKCQNKNNKPADNYSLLSSRLVLTFLFLVLVRSWRSSQYLSLASAVT